jgi:hypothetical protein
MNFIKAVQEAKANSEALPALMRALRQTCGNKVYMRDLEVLLNKLEPLTPHENETLWFLVRDLKR